MEFFSKKPNVKINNPIVPRQVKIAFIGDAGVGKSSVVNYSLEDESVIDLETTNLVDIKFKKITLKPDAILNYGMWDFSGKADSLRIRTELYNELHAVAYCFDVSNPASFKNLEIWMKEIKKNGGNNLIPVCLGLKKDLSFSVDRGTVQSFCKKNNMPFYELSVKDKESMKKFFFEFGEELYDNVKTAKR